MNTIWGVTPLNTPAAVRHCARCGMQPFYSSGRFRVNAQGKALDVWLIYRCPACDATWNAAIYSRVRAAALPAGMLDRLTDNDAQLAREAAFDSAMLKRNNASISCECMEFAIDTPGLGQGCDLDITLRCAHPLDIRAGRLVRQALGVSQNGLERLISAGALRAEADLARVKLSRDVRFWLGANWEQHT